MALALLLALLKLNGFYQIPWWLLQPQKGVESLPVALVQFATQQNVLTSTGQIVLLSQSREETIMAIILVDNIITTYGGIQEVQFHTEHLQICEAIQIVGIISLLL